MAAGTVLLLLLAFSSLSATQLVFREEPSNASVEVGTPHNLSCVAEVEGSSLVNITYLWLHNGQLSASNQTNGELVIQFPTLEDAGSYVCVASYGPLSIQSRVATLTVTQPDATTDQSTVIVISVSVAIIAIILLGIVVCVWLLLCFKRSHIWDKAPMRPRVRHNVLYEEEEEYGYSPKTLPTRSKSLGHLKMTGHQVPQHHDGHITLSSQNLLYGSQPTEVTDLQDDLDLDEALFEHTTSPQNKAYSENDVNEPSTPFLSLDKAQLKSTLIDDYSKRHHRQGDPSHANRGQASRRASNSSCLSDAQSDLSSDLIASQAGSSSLFKSVRFDIDNDSGFDSGVVTGTSTPSHPERRASAPEVKTKRSVERRGSAPECNAVLSNEEEEDVDLSGPEVSGNENIGERTDHSEYSTDQTQPSTVGESSIAGAQDITTTQRECDASDEQPRSPEPLQLQADPTEEATSFATIEAVVHVPPAVSISVDERQPTPKNIAHLISAAEQWTGASSGEVQREPKRHDISRQKVAHMRQLFQQQKSDSVEKNKVVTKQVSQLVTEKTKLFLSQQPQAEQPFSQQQPQAERPSSQQQPQAERPSSQQQPQAERPSSQPEPSSQSEPSSQPSAESPQKSRALTEQVQGVEGSDSGSDLVGLGASGPLLDLSDGNKTAEDREAKDEDSETKDEDSETKDDSKLLKSLASSEMSTGEDNVCTSDGETDESEGEDELMAQFERSRLSTIIPVFTCPFNLSPWQPVHFGGLSTADQNVPLRDSTSETSEKKRPVDEDSDSDSSDDEMVQPLQMQTSFSSISPIGKSLFSQRSRSPISPQVRFQLPGMREAKRIQSPVIEPFYRPQGFQKLGSRLSSIPEETPEMCSSSHDILTLHT